MKQLTIYNMAKLVLGNVNYTGDHSLDTDRAKNIDEYEELIFCLLSDLEATLYDTNNVNGASAELLHNKCKAVFENISEFVNDQSSL